MRFAMIFEGVDRATRVMSKIAAAEKKTAQASKAGAKASEAANSAAVRSTGRLAASFSKVGGAARSAYRGVVAGANAAAKATVALHNKTVALARTGIGNVGAGAGKTFRGLAIGAGIAVTAFGSASLAVTSLLGVATEFEKFQTILETTEGSSAKAKNAMGWVANFAAKTPYELAEVTKAFVMLRARGLDPTNGLLASLGDTSAAMGTGLDQAVEAMADAVTGENERLKAFGITASKAGNKITYSYTNAAGKAMTASVKASDRLAIQAKLMGIFSEKYGGAMEKLSATWSGMVSNLSDIWAQFQLSIMNAGLFDWMKDKLQLLLDTANSMKQAGTFDAWAKDIASRIIFVLETAWKFAQGLWAVMEKLGTYLSMAADYVGGWENLAKILAAMAFAPVLISTAAGIVQIAIGLTMLATALAGLSVTAPLLAIGVGITKVGMAMKALGLALLANPMVLAIAAIVAGAALIYLYWEPIKAFFIGLWDGIASGARQAWNAVKGWLGFDPVAALSSAWSAVSDTVARAWAAIPALTWDNVLTALNWASYIHPIRWLEFIPGFSWSGIINGALDWGSYIVSLDWAKYLPSFSWPELPEFNWPSVPTLELPALPDIVGYIGAFADKGMAEIDALSARLGSAWAKVKSAFTFGGDETQSPMSAADAAALSENTTAALQKLSELDAAAAKIVPAVTGSVGQAHSFLAGVSFYDQGAALMETMAAGMRARAAVVVAEIQRMAQMVRDHLPSSPAKVGPLSDIHRLKFGETIAQSIRAEPMVKAMRAASAATLAAASIAAPNVAAAGSSADAARAQVARASVQSASGSAAGPTYNFNPSLSVQGGNGSPTDIRKAVRDALRESAREFASMIDEEKRRQGRRET